MSMQVYIPARGGMVPIAMSGEGHIDGKPWLLGPWTRGTQYNLPPELVDPQGLASASNIRIGPYGDLTPRGGCTTVGDAAITGTPTLLAGGGHRFSASSTAEWCIGDAKFWENVSGTWTNRTAATAITSTATDVLSSCDAAGHLIFTDGTNPPLKWTAALGNVAAAGIDARFTTAQLVLWWDGRVWYFNTDNSEGEFWHSDVDDRYAIAASNDFDIKTPIYSVQPYGTKLFIHGKKEIWVIQPTGNATTPYRIDQSPTDITCQAPRCALRLPDNRMLIVRADGIYTWDGSVSMTKISGDLDGSRFWDSVVLAGSIIERSHAVLHKERNEVWIWIPFGSGVSQLNYVVPFNYEQNIFYAPWVGIARSCSQEFEGTIYAGGYSTGLLYQHESGQTDNETAIDCAWALSGQAPEGDWTQIQWLFARHCFEAQAANSELSVAQSSLGVDYQETRFDMGGDFASIGVSFAIGVSPIAGTEMLSYKDTDLTGWYPNSSLVLDVNDAGALFKYRHVWLLYQDHGIVREP